jgi:hypothetical protein
MTNENLETIYKEIVVKGEGLFRGVQKCYGSAPSLVLFDDAHHPRRSTLAIPAAKITVDLVRESILTQRLAYTKAALRKLGVNRFKRWLHSS